MVRENSPDAFQTFALLTGDIDTADYGRENRATIDHPNGTIDAYRDQTDSATELRLEFNGNSSSGEYNLDGKLGVDDNELCIIEPESKKLEGDKVLFNEINSSALGSSRESYSFEVMDTETAAQLGASLATKVERPNIPPHFSEDIEYNSRIEQDVERTMNELLEQQGLDYLE